MEITKHVIQNKGKWSIAAVIGTVASGVAVWAFLGLPTVMFSHQIPTATQIAQHEVYQEVGASYIQDRLYSLNRQRIDIMEKLRSLPASTNMSSRDHDFKRMLLDQLSRLQQQIENAIHLDKKLH